MRKNARMYSVTIANWEKYNDSRKDVKNHSWFRFQIDAWTSVSLFELTAEEKWIWVCFLSLSARFGTADVLVSAQYLEELSGAGRTAVKSCIRKLIKSGVFKKYEPSTYRARDEHVTLRTNERTNEQTGVSLFSFSDLQRLWNYKCPQLPKIITLTPNRRNSWNKRWEERPDAGYWESVLEKLASNEFCNGKNSKNWRADVDFLLKPDIHVRLMEGSFDSAEKAEKAFIGVNDV